MKIITISLLSALLLSTAAHAAVGTERLTVEGRVAPSGIDVSVPRFGWVLNSDADSTVQQSYRIVVATSERAVKRLKGLLWDSGTVRSDSSQWVAYKGERLKPDTRYYWRVLVNTNRGAAKWSETSSWSTGLMGEEQWSGQWIGLDSLVSGDSQTRHSRVASRYLRKEFNCGKNILKATMHISGLGLYSLFINGQRVGRGLMTPVGTDYTKTVAYDTYDVTPLLRQKNAIGVVLAGGHYYAQTQNFESNVRTTYGFPKLRAYLIILYNNGKRETVATDATWKLSTDGPMRYANEYDGELFDARKTMDFASHGYNDSSWMQAQIVGAPGGRMRGNITPPMTVYMTEKPAMIKSRGQKLIVDFGTNGAGRVNLHINAHRGDTLRIRHAELLNAGDSTLYTTNLRKAEATAWFVSDGTERDWTPEFTYYGFRYAEISLTNNNADITEAVDTNSIRRELIADEMDDSGTDITFYGDEKATMLNKIVANARRGVRSNYKGMPIDCPQRDERMPWLGDRTTGSLGESYLMNNHALYAKWVADIRDSQRENGALSDVAPAYWSLYRTNVTWPAALPFSADMLYRQYGDLRPMRDSYEAIARWLRLIRSTIYKEGLVTYDRYGDWCVPPEEKHLIHSKDPMRKTDGTLLSSCYYYYICRMMGRYARLLGRTNDVSYYENEAILTSKAVNAAFLKDGSYSNGTATANVLPLAMGIVPDSCRKAVEASLMNTITIKNNGHVSCGVIGIQWLMRLLTDTGHCGTAFNMATTPEYPGWGYMVEHGATTIWELWNGDTADPAMNSGNHVMLLGDLLPWCYERLGGIRPDNSAPGFKHVILQPDFSVPSLTGVDASHRSPYGLIHSSWRRTKDGIEWHVTLPPNTTAELRRPNAPAITVGSGEHTLRF